MIAKLPKQHFPFWRIQVCLISLKYSITLKYIIHQNCFLVLFFKLNAMSLYLNFHCTFNDCNFGDIV